MPPTSIIVAQVIGLVNCDFTNTARCQEIKTDIGAIITNNCNGNTANSLSSFDNPETVPNQNNESGVNAIIAKILKTDTAKIVA